MDKHYKLSQKANILYVDNDPSACNDFQHMLENEGLIVDVAHSDVQALNLVNQQSNGYAVILVSLYPSLLNDYSLVELLGRAAPDSCLIALTYSDTDIPEDQTVTCNIAAIFPKPWDKTELLYTLRQALELHQIRLIRKRTKNKQQTDRLLLIEDNAADSDLILTLLGDSSAYASNTLKVHVCHTLAQALVVLQTQQFSAVLTDLNLPDSQGLNTITRLFYLIDIPIIVYSGHKETEIALRALQLGAQDYLEKSALTAASLHRAIQYALERFHGYCEHRKLLTQNPDGIVVLDEQGDILFANAAAAKLYNLTDAELLGENFGIPVGGKEAIEIKVTSGRYVEMHVLDTDWHGQRAQLVTLRDISEHKNVQAQLSYQANHDPLTGLANRTILAERLLPALQTVRRGGTMAAVLMLDLDRFKLINDTLGHHVGDQLLQQVAARLSSVVRETDTVARVGGDEFVILTEGIHHNDDVARLAEKIVQRLADDFLIAGKHITVTVSIGIALCPRDGNLVEDLLKCADAAMYRTKESGRNNYQFYDEAIHQSMVRRLSLESRLLHGLAKQEFCLYLQPQVSKSGIKGAEVLLRWHPEGQAMVPPVDFIPLLEQSGLIFDIELWVLEQSCILLQQWQQQGSKLHLAVNLSAISLQKPTLPEIIAGLLARYQVPPACLEIEIVESVLLNDLTQARATLSSLDALGVSISLDDFGTGYSSIGYLLEFDMIDVLKLDCSFVWKMEQTARNWAILKSVVSLAHSLEMGIVAEGIETPRQLKLLLSLGCYCYQGYLFAKPMPLADWPIFVKNWLGLNEYSEE